MATRSTFEHRHYKVIAAVIAAMPTSSMRLRASRERAARHFANYFASTNPRFDCGRFLAAAKGEPINGRDRVRLQG